MPQITLEYTSNIRNSENFNPLVIRVHKILESLCSVNINNCKTRINRIENFVIGNGNSNKKFLHLEVKLFQGRSQEIISSLGKSLINILEKFNSTSLNDPDLDITVHIIDIERNKYFKYSAE